jgi:hypothetical protein
MEMFNEHLVPPNPLLVSLLDCLQQIPYPTPLPQNGERKAIVPAPASATTAAAK